MKTEMVFLLWAVALTFVQVLIAVQGAVNQVGLAALAQNREGLPEIKGWAGRARRAHLNMLENMALFVPLVLLVVAADKASTLTHLGVQLFFWGRVAYLVVYLIGIPWLRTAVWTVSVVGLFLLFIELL
jgi:uncharacterized MAPEG superfamily protein